MKKRKKSDGGAVTAVLIVIFLVGLSLLLYPSVSGWWNGKVQSRAVASYDRAVESMAGRDYTAYYEAAREYNEALYTLGSAAALSDPNTLGGYGEVLDITGTGVMGYVTIERLNVELPIYHGTDSGVLSSGAGHLQGSSLPVGGESTHCVISAHRGLPSSVLFTHLDQMEIGDTFTVTVLDEVLTYVVDQITIVLPTEYGNLYIEEGEDYCTLMTCTPYGINTHRLLVRGVRTLTGETRHIRVSSEAYRVDPVLVAPFIAFPPLLVLLIWFTAGAPKGGRKTPEERAGKREDADGENTKKEPSPADDGSGGRK